MSASLVREAMELFSDDAEEHGSSKKKRKDADNASLETNKSKKQQRKKKRPSQQLATSQKKHQSNAFDEKWRYVAVDNTESNLQRFKEQELFHAADDKTVELVMEHQRGKLAKNRLPSRTEIQRATQSQSVFTDKDFEKFEKEYVF